MKDIFRSPDVYYDDLRTSEAKPINRHSNPWLCFGYDVVDIDLDRDEDCPHIKISGEDWTKITSPSDLKLFLMRSHKEKIFYPTFGDRDVTSTTIHQEKFLLKVFPREFLIELTTTGSASWGLDNWILYPEALCVEVSKQGRPKFWLTNVFNIVKSRETLEKDLSEFLLNLTKVFWGADPPTGTPEDTTDPYPPRYLASGRLARQLFLAYNPNFNINIKETIPEEYLKPFLNLKGQRFSPLGLGMTDSKVVADYVKLYKNIGKTLVPPIEGVTGTFIKSTKYQEDATYASLDIVGTLPLLEKSGILPVRQAIPHIFPKPSTVFSPEVETRLTYPIGPTDYPIKNISKEEYEAYKIRRGIDLEIVDGTWFIPFPDKRELTGQDKKQMEAWENAVEALVSWNPTFKWLYQLAFTGGTYPIFDKVTHTPDGHKLSHTYFYQKGYSAVSGTNHVVLSKIFGMSRLLVKELQMDIKGSAMVADGSPGSLIGPSEILGYQVKYKEVPHNIFIFDPTRIDEEDTEWQERVYKNRDKDALPTLVKSRVSLHQVLSNSGISTKMVGRKRNKTFKLKPSSGDMSIRVPFEDSFGKSWKLGYLLDGFYQGIPLKTNQRSDPGIFFFLGGLPKDLD